MTIGESRMSTSYTESNLYKVTRKSYRMQRCVGSRDPVTGKYKGIILSKDDTKREYFGVCEVCGLPIPDGKHKDYHHWDKELPAMGIWVCYKCHKIIEGVDAGVAEVYLRKKLVIEKDYAMKQYAKTGLKMPDDWGK